MDQMLLAKTIVLAASAVGVHKIPWEPVQLIKIKRTVETGWWPMPAAGRSVAGKWTMTAGAAKPLRSTRAASASG